MRSLHKTKIEGFRAESMAGILTLAALSKAIKACQRPPGRKKKDVGRGIMCSIGDGSKEGDSEIIERTKVTGAKNGWKNDRRCVIWYRRLR